MMSIVIPARNEAKCLPRCLAAIANAAQHLHSEHEIIVVLNRCTDDTEQIALRSDCRVIKNDSKNLASIRNSGVRSANGDLVVTVDADSYMSETMLAKIEKSLANPGIVGGGVLMIPERWSLGIFFTYLALIPVALIYRISAGLFFFRKESFDAIGGFDENWFTAEDIDFARRLRAYGKSKHQRFKTIFSSHIVTSCRKFDEFGDWYALKNPHLFYQVLSNKNKAAGNTYWYDVER